MVKATQTEESFEEYGNGLNTPTAMQSQTEQFVQVEQEFSPPATTSSLGLSIDTPASIPGAGTSRSTYNQASLEDRLRDLESRLAREKILEERVQQLETKLSVLSRLLQIHNKNGTAIDKKSPSVTTKSSAVGSERLKFDNTNDKFGPVPPPPPPPDWSPPQSSSSSAHELKKAAAGSATSSPPRENVETRQDSAHNIPPLDSPASFIGKDTESARLSWEKETGGAPTFPILEGVDQEGDTTTKTAPSAPTTSNRRLHTDSAASSSGASLSQPESLSSHKRNLSFSILYEGNVKAYERGKLTKSAPPAQTSMTLAERRWLGSLAQSISGEREEIPDANVRDKWLNYLNSFQESTHDVDVQMEEFIKVPGQVEGIMNFGFYICIDSFLYCVTVLPIRFVWSCLLLVNRLMWKQTTPAFTFHRRHSYQIIQVFILYVIYAYVLAPISIGQLYHWIRGQAMIKLYVLIAIVEVFDRLMCSMGQDCLDSMYWNTVNRPTSARMLISVLVVLVYCTIHTLFLFVHVATLNVAMNSADQALLTLLISGNFAEIKSTVFKKYNRPALFKLTASDICERFKLGLFLSLVLLLNYSQGMAPGQLFHFLRTCGIIWGAELVADWIKHAFITKFNFLPSRVFVEYSLLLAGDVTGIGHEGVNVDHSHAVVKRIGFAQLPFVCVMFRLVREAAKYAWMNEFWQSLSTGTVYGIFTASWLVLLFIKLALGSLLHQISFAKLRAAPDLSLSPKKKKKS